MVYWLRPTETDHKPNHKIRLEYRLEYKYNMQMRMLNELSTKLY